MATLMCCIYLTVLFTTVLEIATSAPFCSPDSGCNCYVEESCTVCPNGLATSPWSVPDSSIFSLEITCLHLAKGYAKDLIILKDMEKLSFFDVHKYTLPLVSQETLPLNRNWNLTYLNISGNGITQFSDDSFKGLSNLHYLDLSNNQIQSIPATLFLHLDLLEYLYLQDNLISTLEPLVFSRLNKLTLLNLHDNKLDFIHHEQISNLTSHLMYLDLGNNNLKGLPNEVINNFANLKDLKLNNNPWDCSCSVATLAEFLQSNASSGIQISEPNCRTPPLYKGLQLSELLLGEVSCTEPVITFISEPHDHGYGAKFTLSCEAMGHPTPAILWMTPIGDYFGHPSGFHLLGQSHLVKVMSENTYIFSDHFQSTHVTSRKNGEITVDGMRGALRGNFTCYAINPAGIDMNNVTLSVHTGIPVTYSQSLIYCAMVTGGFIVVSIFISLIRCLVNKCGKTKELEITEKQDLESNTSIEHVNEGIEDDFEDEDDYPPSDGSPMLSDRISIPSCKTPTNEDYDKFSPEFPENIRETLDDVRWRLRHGVERKMERVRSHVQTIRSSGSQYIGTLRTSSSHAANRVRAGVVMGMEQVKYGVQSIKEFCGTGDMGTQTISTISVSTDVDTQKSIETIKTICSTDV